LRSFSLWAICTEQKRPTSARAIAHRRARLGHQIALLGYLVSLFLHGHFQRYLWMLLGLAAALARMAPAAVLDDRRTRP
jgi:hypothetical protein